VGGAQAREVVQVPRFVLRHGGPLSERNRGAGKWISTESVTMSPFGGAG